MSNRTYKPVFRPGPKKGLGFTTRYIVGILTVIGLMAFLNAYLEADSFAYLINKESSQYNSTDPLPSMEVKPDELLFISMDYCYSCDVARELSREIAQQNDLKLRFISLNPVDAALYPAPFLYQFEIDTLPAVLVNTSKGYQILYPIPSPQESFQQVFQKIKFPFSTEGNRWRQADNELGLQLAQFETYTGARSAALELSRYWDKEIWVHNATNNKYSLIIGAFNYEFLARMSSLFLEDVFKKMPHSKREIIQMNSLESGYVALPQIAKKK